MKYALTILVVSLTFCALLYFTFDYYHEKNKIIQNYKSNFIKDDFLKKKTSIEKTFALLYQSIRTISLLPSIRDLSGNNRKNEKEDVVKLNRFSKEGAMTVQQLYNNLVSNVSVSEIYAILNGFNPKKGEIPFFMYDKPLLSETEKKIDQEEKKTSDTPEESEESEYKYFPELLNSLQKNYSEINYSKGLEGIPAISSPLMRTCDNDQYKSKKEGDLKNAEGFIYSVPFYGKDLKLKGTIAAIIRSNNIEALLVGVPKLVITQDDQKEFNEKKWDIPNEPIYFSIFNKKTNLFLKDRRVQQTENEIDNFHKIIENKDLSHSIYFEKLDIKDESEWILSYDFSSQPWKSQTNELLRLYQIKISALIFVCFLILFFSFHQKSKIHSIVNDIFVKLQTVNLKIIDAGVDAKKNGSDLSDVSSNLAAITHEMVAAINEIESQATHNSETTKGSQMISAQLSSEINIIKDHLKSLQHDMNQIMESNKKVHTLIEVINKIKNKTKIIEDIVFKTELLSFNASIEAARAGEAGKGFSVVSMEVGELAQAIKNSAQEISTIIVESESFVKKIANENTQCVDHGNKSVDKLCETMSSVQSSTHSLNEKMESIATATLQQLTGIKQIVITTTDIQRIMDKNNKLSKASLEIASHLQNQTNEQKKVMEKISTTFDLNHSSIDNNKVS